MPINFPNSPVNGTTYDYLGVRYQYDGSTSPGFWKVLTPGTAGAATGAEVTAGTDNAKYVTAKAMEDSDYWSAHNDGAGSGLDADHVDGKSMAYVKSGRKNLIMNGDFRFWQRGIGSFNNEYSFDRWLATYMDDGVSHRDFTIEAKLDYTWSGNVSAFGLFKSLDATANRLEVIQRIESQGIRSAQDKTLGLSFKIARNGSISNNPDVVATIRYATAYDNYTSPTNVYVYNLGKLLTLCPTSKSFTKLTQIVPSFPQLYHGIEISLKVEEPSGNPFSTASTEIALSEVQLEVGDEITDFEIRSAAEELALCQRYYQVCRVRSAIEFVNNRWPYVTTSFATKMRATPSVVYTDVTTANMSSGPSTASIWDDAISVAYPVVGIANNRLEATYKMLLDAEL